MASDAQHRLTLQLGRVRMGGLASVNRSRAYRGGPGMERPSLASDPAARHPCPTRGHCPACAAGLTGQARLNQAAARPRIQNLVELTALLGAKLGANDARGQAIPSHV